MKTNTNTKQIGYDLKRVNKVNISVIFLVSIILLLQTIILKGFGPEFSSGLPRVLIVCIISLIIFFIPIKDQVKGGLFSLVTSLVAFQTLITEVRPASLFLLVLSFAMCALYFQKELVVIIGLLIDVFLILIYIKNPGAVTVLDNKQVYFINLFIFFNGTVTIIYFFTRWGR